MSAANAAFAASLGLQMRETTRMRATTPNKGAPEISHVGTPAPGPDFDSYLSAIRQFPMLTADEEADLAKRWREHGDVKAGDKLVTSHLRLAASIALRYRGYGLPAADLVAEANLGLMEALQRFDPERGARFATYATWWIRTYVLEYILNSYFLVKVGAAAAQKKLFFRLRGAKARRGLIDGQELAPEDVRGIAEELGVKESEVVQMNHRFARRNRSLTAPVAPDSETMWAEALANDKATYEEMLADRDELAHQIAQLSHALQSLTPRQRDIVESRYLKAHRATLKQLGRRHGVSLERIRQIEVQALERLRDSMKAVAEAV